ncbi:MAG: metal-sulfur cluster assembly factor [Firmicutes bacterium]|nr:metal-sulfur cluster assembly factor [Bacillota bacterium]MCL5038501.1 metal-sulfur cluster assembly factor [Bacillota bacterium]
MVTEEEVTAALKEVYDPEIGINIVDLGLIYETKIEEEDRVKIKMTLTVPGCPLAQMLVEQARQAVAGIPGVKDAQVELVWDPPWTPDRMSKELRRF